ncbi:uncharacterized protein METZ01_LOCUS463478 [marine metagenome]|uniref:Uncharacterized protein n=1 Tax=marine metagenome TaxID=408172 RepID=A0A383ASF8_9ZZZZ
MANEPEIKHARSFAITKTLSHNRTGNRSPLLSGSADHGLPCHLSRSMVAIIPQKAIITAMMMGSRKARSIMTHPLYNHQTRHLLHACHRVDNVLELLQVLALS